MPQQNGIYEKNLGRIDGGLNIKYEETEITDNQSPYLLNVYPDNGGLPIKRPGTITKHTFPEGPVHSLSDEYKGLIIAHAGESLYSYNELTDVEVKLITGLSSIKGSFFIYMDYLYYINSAQFIQWDGSTATHVKDNAYIPKRSVGRSPDGTTSTPLESNNLLSAGVRNLFTGTAGVTEYVLDDTNLDATLVTAVVNGVALTEPTHLSVNRTALPFAKVTFNVAPGEVTIDNVDITFYKTDASYLNKILNNKYVGLFGGNNDTSVFLGGDSDNPYTYRYNQIAAGSIGANYWPDDNDNTCDSSKGAIYGFGNHSTQLIVLQEKGVGKVDYTPDNTIKFPYASFKGSIGCDMPWSIQVINNDLVFANTYQGVFILTKTDVKDENNIYPLSSLINGNTYRPGLLAENKTALRNAVSFDTTDQYYLCVGSIVWLWHYGNKPYQGDDEKIAWFYYENINGNCFVETATSIFFGDRTTGKLYKFQEAYNDDGEAIPARQRIKNLFGDPVLFAWLKTIADLRISFRPNMYSEMYIRHFSDKGEKPFNGFNVDNLNLDDGTLNRFDTFPISKSSSFNMDTGNIDTLTLSVYVAAPTLRKRPKLRNTIHYQYELGNEELNQGFSIMNSVVTYVLNKKKR